MDEPEVALVHRPRHDDWSLPKGKVHHGEPVVLAARREAVEETGYVVALGASLGRTHYRVDEHGEPAEKRVDYWAARCGDAGERSGDEVDGLAWLPVDAAAEQVSWDTDREVLGRFARLPLATTTVLLVRHARAGSASGWERADAERPLDDAGLLQKERLALALPSFWLPSERPVVASAPIVRCFDTVAWAGDVGWDDRLGQHASAVDPAPAVACVRELATHPVAIACSQGDVIPGVVEALRRADGLPAGSLRSAKGSVWVLSFAAGRLVAADYLDAV